MNEEALILGPHQSNVGVFTPADNHAGGPSNMAVICITAGLLHHAGPHRMHVVLARELAKYGISTLRFDLSGIGDSAARTDDLVSHELPVQEINEAMHTLGKRGFTRFIFFGICSGAVRALKAAADNPKVAGLILVNIPNDEGSFEMDSELAVQFYLKKSMWNLNAWKNFLTGKVDYRVLFHTLLTAIKRRLTTGNLRPASFEDSLRASLQPYLQQGTSVISVLSDRNAQIYEMHKGAYENLQSDQYKTLVYKHSDHLLTSLDVQRDLVNELCQWSAELAASDAEFRPPFVEEMSG